MFKNGRADAKACFCSTSSHSPTKHPAFIGLGRKEVEQSSEFGPRNQCCVRHFAPRIPRNSQLQTFPRPFSLPRFVILESLSVHSDPPAISSFWLISPPMVLRFPSSYRHRPTILSSILVFRLTRGRRRTRNRATDAYGSAVSSHQT